MEHRPRDTYSLTHLRQHTSDHLERLAAGRVETITQNGEAAMVVMSPETYDAMRIDLERVHRWDQAIARFGAGPSGRRSSTRPTPRAKNLKKTVGVLDFGEWASVYRTWLDRQASYRDEIQRVQDSGPSLQGLVRVAS